MTKIYVVRHGETAWNVEGKHTGRSDIPINSRGKEPAASLQPFFASLSSQIKKVWSSPLKRAFETGQLAGFTDIQEDPRLMEWHYGAYEGKTSQEIHAEEPTWNIFADGAKNGESVEDVEKRAGEVIDMLTSFPEDQVVFSHGHFSRVLLMKWLSLPVEKAALFSLGNAAVAVLQLSKEKRSLLQWNLQF